MAWKIVAPKDKAQPARFEYIPEWPFTFTLSSPKEEKHMKPFLFVIWIKPTKKSEDNGTGRAAVIYGPDVVIASDEKQATLLAAREIPDDYMKDLNRVEVSVRPF